ncbi:MAG: isoprenylcysteine carboxylmethyltransferase family protein [Alphaproteobacteria bacterium]|nr:isoprenylcysteine carboxylmethyltransferase family protein [Alphaproteobacteria bacterium]
MWGFAALAPGLDIEIPFRLPLAVLLALAGLALTGSGILSFIRAKTSFEPRAKAEMSALVVSGLYRFTRNPMYLGMLLVLLALAVWLAHLGALALAPGFVLYMNRYQIAPEERALALHFGEAYTAYKNRVRRWL